MDDPVFLQWAKELEGEARFRKLSGGSIKPQHPRYDPWQATEDAAKASAPAGGAAEPKACYCAKQLCQAFLHNSLIIKVFISITVQCQIYSYT